MNFTELSDAVLAIVKRPDKAAQVGNAINTALARTLFKTEFTQDLVEATIPLDPARVKRPPWSPPPHANPPPQHRSRSRVGRCQMTTVTQAAEYLSRLIEQGFGHYDLKLGTRGLDSLRQDGRELDLCLSVTCAETAHDGREVTYLS